MHSRDLLSLCLILFLCSTAVAVAARSSEIRIMTPIERSVKILQTISNPPQEYVSNDATTDRARVQHAPTQAAPLRQGQVDLGLRGFHAGSSLPSAAPSDAVSASAPPPPVWDEQLGQSFTQNFTSLDYNVTAVEQSDVNGYGPAYLLSGLCANGYWYQVGLSWDWPYLSGGYDSGFHLNYEVFDSSGISIYPSSSGGLTDFSGTVDQGDTVLLSLHFSGGNVTIYGYDFNTSASAQESYSAEGATDFTGTPLTTANSNGFFTGLMTEWYHVSEYYGNEASVHYSDSTFALSSAWMWIDEFDPNNGTTLFSAGNSVSYSNSTQLQYFSSNGATEASDAQDFITGTANLVPITLSYSVVGGGTGYDPATLTYFSSGEQYVATLTTSPTTYYIDPGSIWNASDPLSGSSSTEIWSSNQQTSNVANSSQAINIVYFHQYLVNLGYTLTGISVGYSPPNVTIEQFGAMYAVTMPTSVFVDAGSQCLYPNPLLGSNSTMRWGSQSTAVTVSSSTTLIQTYYSQYNFSASYSISGGSGYSAPVLHGAQFGGAYASTLTVASMTYWLDSGTSWSVDGTLLGSGNAERWITTATTISGTMSSPATFSFVYIHQFYVDMELNAAVGGSISPTSSWFNSSQQVQISAEPNSGWQFENWNGSGASSYNGESNSTTLAVDSPIVEYATFYAGLTLSVSSYYGTVTYSYSSGFGYVSSVSSEVLYVPLNASVSLTANASFYIFQFKQWSGATTSTAQQIQITVTAPAVLRADFDYDWINITVTIVVIAVGLALLAILILIRSSVTRKSTH